MCTNSRLWIRFAEYPILTMSHVSSVFALHTYQDVNLVQRQLYSTYNNVPAKVAFSKLLVFMKHFLNVIIQKQHVSKLVNADLQCIKQS